MTDPDSVHRFGAMYAAHVAEAQSDKSDRDLTEKIRSAEERIMTPEEMEYFEEAEKAVESIREAALRLVQATHPEIRYVIDRRTIDDYSYKTWDYPGKWYYAGFKLPGGFRSKEDLIRSIAEETILHFGKKK